MRIQKQPNGWSCFPTAFAMVLDMDVQDLIAVIGHDGSEILWPELEPPRCYRSWHYQEIVMACFELNFNVVHLQNKLISAPIPGETIHITEIDLNCYTDDYEGVVGVTGHAFAFSRGRFYDPAFGKMVLPRQEINHVWIIKSE